MSVAVELEDNELTVVPGAEVTCEVRVRNTGHVVDQFTLELVGDNGSWTTVEPGVLNLLPDGEATARLVFTPPRSAEVLAGHVPFGVRVLSREDPASSVVEEGGIEVEPFTELAAELVPTRRHGRRRAKYRLAVDNTGNTMTVTTIHAADQDDELKLTVDPQVAHTKPGTTTLVKVKTQPHKRFLRGQTKTLPFQVVVSAQDEEPLATDGVMLQEQLMPKWLLPAVAALVVGIGALIAFWFTILKPTVQSVAKEQVQQQVQQAENAAKKADTAAQKAAEAVQGNPAGSNPAGSNPPGQSSTDQQPGGTKAPSARNASSAKSPVSFRIAAEANPVTDGSFQRFTYVAPDGKAVDIGDLVLQNPRGDNGILRISIGDKVVLEAGMANFRDLDYHYLNPLHANPGQPVAVSINCVTPGAGSGQCTPSVSFSGQLSK